MKWARYADRVSTMVGVPVSRKHTHTTAARILYIFTLMTTRPTTLVTLPAMKK